VESEVFSWLSRSCVEKGIQGRFEYGESAIYSSQTVMKSPRRACGHACFEFDQEQGHIVVMHQGGNVVSNEMLGSEGRQCKTRLGCMQDSAVWCKHQQQILNSIEDSLFKSLESMDGQAGRVEPERSGRHATRGHCRTVSPVRK